MNYAIIGMGFIFSRHVEAIKKTGGRVLMTCDIDSSKHPTFLDYRKMFKNEQFKKNIDAVVICTPNYLHKQMVKDALATGKKVLCEKPLIIDEDSAGLEGVNTVLQLRYHDLIPEIKKVLIEDGHNDIELIMKVYRDDNWWKSWRGDESLAGNILMGLAIHMFDFLIFMLGDAWFIHESNRSREKCTGTILFNHTSHTIVKYCVEVMDSKEGQTRKFIINGHEFELCNKDNLSFAGYHDQVYEHFIAGDGIPLEEAMKSVKLILKL